METPEKIYLGPALDALTKALSVKTEDDVEYTRTDAFIEKACEYLSYHLDTSKIDVNYKFEFIEEFRNCMKGE